MDDCTRQLGISSLMKCTSAIRQLAYGSVPDSLDEYLQMGATTARKSLQIFCKVIMNLYGEEFLRKPTYTDMEKHYARHDEKHGFPGMLGSIDYSFILLEAIATNDLWIWHAFFGVSGINNDVNVLRQSPIFNDLKSGKAPDVPFVANNVSYKRGYYLTDGIYPQCKSHNVLGIAPVAIIDRQLPFEYTITSRSTDVVVVASSRILMTHPVQNINHSAFRLMFEREKLSGNNFNDWFRQLKLVLRVKKKRFVIKHPLPAAHAANSEAHVWLEWNAVYDAYNEVSCLILGSIIVELHRQFENSSPYDMIKELKAMFEKQAGVERFDLIQTFHACKKEEGKPVAAYVIQMKGYVDQLNTVGELHAMLIEYEKGLPKKAETPQANGKGKDKQVYIPKPKNPKPSAKEHPAKDDACHHCKEVGHWKRNYPVYLAELLKKKKQGFREARKLKQGALYLYVGNGVRAQDYALESATSILNMVPTKKVDKTPYELWSERTRRAPNRLCLNVEAEEHSLGDLNEPTSYKAAILDSESNKWIDAMNAEI
ncbi:RNA-directed DNA polymerase, eukaryota [Tanacetum coccineum]